jgi:O-antigen ligase/polysaccharide polymerase Wzy-like membrane protein
VDLRHQIQPDTAFDSGRGFGRSAAALRSAVLGGGRGKVLLVLLLATACGVGAPILLPRLGLLPVALAVVVVFTLWLLGAADRARLVFVGGLGALLIGYAFLGRGLAHAGVPPVYVGEMVLGLGVLALVFGRPTFRLDLVRVLLVLFMAWGAIQTVPYFGRYGVDALRDAVTWGYAFFALAIAALVRGPDLLRAVDRYRSLIVPFCLFILLTLPLPSASLPKLPGSEVSVISPKSGDTAVHLAGIAAFVLIGLYAAARSRFSEFFVWLAWLPTAGLIGVVSRGGLGALAMSGLAVLFGRAPARLVTPLFVVLIAIVTLVYVDPVVDLGLNRKISVGQVVENVTSVFGSSNDPALEGTKDFRLRWWGKIFDYTVGGPYFWTGKGFGVNLADEDGFQVYADHSLRAPHNGHVEILARMGVPGLALWIALNLAWAVGVVLAIRRARGAGSRTWAAVLIWLFVYWSAMMVNASFDPYLQGPQGGIWYWTVIGAGLVAINVVRSLPSVRVAARLPTRQPAAP